MAETPFADYSIDASMETPLLLYNKVPSGCPMVRSGEKSMSQKRGRILVGIAGSVVV